MKAFHKLEVCLSYSNPSEIACLGPMFILCCIVHINRKERYTLKYLIAPELSPPSSAFLSRGRYILVDQMFECDQENPEGRKTAPEFGRKQVKLAAIKENVVVCTFRFV